MSVVWKYSKDGNKWEKYNGTFTTTRSLSPLSFGASRSRTFTSTTRRRPQSSSPRRRRFVRSAKIASPRRRRFARSDRSDTSKKIARRRHRFARSDTKTATRQRSSSPRCRRVFRPDSSTIPRPPKPVESSYSSIPTDASKTVPTELLLDLYIDPTMLRELNYLSNQTTINIDEFKIRMPKIMKYVIEQKSVAELLNSNNNYFNTIKFMAFLIYSHSDNATNKEIKMLPQNCKYISNLT